MDRKLRQETDRTSQSVDKGHGRLERRGIEVTSRLNGYLDWPGVAAVMKVTRDVASRGKTTHETAYAISSVAVDRLGAPGFLRAIRDHWAIENRLHWSRDVVFGEDRCRVRSGRGAQTFAAIRNTVIGLLNLRGVRSIAVETRRLSRLRRLVEWV